MIYPEEVRRRQFEQALEQSIGFSARTLKEERSEHVQDRENQHHPLRSHHAQTSVMLDPGRNIVSMERRGGFPTSTLATEAVSGEQSPPDSLADALLIYMGRRGRPRGCSWNSSARRCCMNLREAHTFDVAREALELQ